MKLNSMLTFIVIFVFIMSGCSYTDVIEYENEQFNLSADTALNQYANFLQTFITHNENTVYQFSVKDLDNCGIPELIIVESDTFTGLNALLTVYKCNYNGEIYKIGEYSNPKGSFTGGFRISSNSEFSGLFEDWWGGGKDYYGYILVDNEELIYEPILCIDNTYEPSQKIEITDNIKLIEELGDIYPPYDSSESILEFYDITNDNIDKIL